MKPAEFFQQWNQQAPYCPNPQSLADQIQVQKPILVVATNQMPDQGFIYTVLLMSIFELGLSFWML